MLMPSIYGDNLFDEFFDDFPLFGDKALRRTEKKLYGKKGCRMMRTDIREKDCCYEFLTDLPGFAKEEIRLMLDNGYLTIHAEKHLDESETDEATGKYIRKERYAGTCSRRFYVGNEITEEDVKAEFKHGILKVQIPKKDAAPESPDRKCITIEG